MSLDLHSDRNADGADEGFPATVTLDAAVPAPGAVLWVGSVPPVLRRPGAWPEGCASFRPWPVGHAGQGEPPPPPTDPDDCGHGPDCKICSWAGDHWHRWGQTSSLYDHSGCCACPDHNPDGGSSGSPSPAAEPVVYQGASGLAAAFKPFEGGDPFPLAGGPLPDKGVVAVTGVTPSASPHDRSVSFTRYDPSVPATYCEVDRFTVMSLDLQPDAYACRTHIILAVPVKCDRRSSHRHMPLSLRLTSGQNAYPVPKRLPAIARGTAFLFSRSGNKWFNHPFNAIV